MLNCDLVEIFVTDRNQESVAQHEIDSKKVNTSSLESSENTYELSLWARLTEIIYMGDANDMIPDRIGNFDLNVNLTEPCVVVKEQEEQHEDTSDQDKAAQDNSADEFIPDFGD